MTVPLSVQLQQPATPLTGAAPPPHRLNEQDLGWRTAINLLRRRVRLILLVTLATALLALPLILSVEKTYYGQARLLFAPDKTIDLSGEPAQSATTLDLPTEIERLVSRDSALAVIDRFKLAEREEFNPDLQPDGPVTRLVDGLRSLFGGATSAEGDALAEDTMDRVVESFLGSLGVSRQGTTDVVTVGFTSRDPELAAAVPNAIAEIHRTRSTERWQAEIAETLAWLDSRIAADKEQLARSRATLAELRGSTGVASEAASDTTSARLDQLGAQRADIDRERLELRQVLDSIALSEQNPELPALNEPDTITAVRRELQGEQRALDALSSTFGDRYEGVTSRKAHLEALRTELATELAGFRHAIEARDAALVQRATDLDAQSSALGADLEKQRLALPEVARLAKVVLDQTEALSLLEYRRQNLVAESQIPRLQLDILSPATVPLGPDGPSRKALLLAAILGGLFLGLTVAGIAELRDGGIRGHEQLGHLGQFLPVGLLPALPDKDRRTLADTIRSRQDTPFAEALRDAVFMIECANGGEFPSSLLVTGSIDTETPVAEWLAAELIASGRKVLLIEAGADADEDPSPPRVGDNEMPLARRIQRDRSGGFSRLALGKDLPRDARGQAAFRELLLRVSSDDTVTIIDGPSLDHGAALRIGQLAQRSLLVLQWGRTSRATAELFAGLLAKVQVVKALTLIVNVDVRRHRRYGFGDRISLRPVEYERGA